MHVRPLLFDAVEMSPVSVNDVRYRVASLHIHTSLVSVQWLCRVLTSLPPGGQFRKVYGIIPQQPLGRDVRQPADNSFCGSFKLLGKMLKWQTLHVIHGSDAFDPRIPKLFWQPSLSDGGVASRLYLSSIYRSHDVCIIRKAIGSRKIPVNPC